MNREDHLKFCRICENKHFDSTKGIICKLTNEIADFETDCEHFIGNRTELLTTDSKQKDVGELDEKLIKFFKRIMPKEGFILTPIIAVICIIIFVLMSVSGVHVFEPDNESLLSWGANFKVLTLDGEYWRIITNCFIHIGLFHLLFNIYALLIIGFLLEPIIGKYKFGIAYLVSGISASVISLWWNDFVISAGASGAIFGMYGVLLALLSTKVLKRKTDKNLLISIIVFVGYNLLYGLKGGIDNAAHIGGLLSGIIIGFALIPSISNPVLKIRNQFIYLLSIFGLLIFSLFIIIKTPNTLGEYDKLIAKFTKYEDKALKNYYFLPYMNNNDYLKTIKEEGIPNWKRCKLIINKIDSLEDLPEILIENTRLLNIYCDYRLESFDLMAKSLNSNNAVNDLKIISYNFGIEKIIRKLEGENIADSLIIIQPGEDVYSLLPKDLLYIVDGNQIKFPVFSDFKKIISVKFINKQTAYQTYGVPGRLGVLIIRTE